MEASLSSLACPRLEPALSRETHPLLPLGTSLEIHSPLPESTPSDGPFSDSPSAPFSAVLTAVPNCCSSSSLIDRPICSPSCQAQLMFRPDLTQYFRLREDQHQLFVGGIRDCKRTEHTVPYSSIRNQGYQCHSWPLLLSASLLVGIKLCLDKADAHVSKCHLCSKSAP